MVIAEDMLVSTDGNKRAERAATAKAVGEIETPAARGAELDGRGLFRGVANAAAAWPGHGAEFFGELDPHVHSAMAAGQITDHFAGVACVLIDVND